VRSKSTRRPPVLTHLPDGSFLSDLQGLPVRIIDAELTVTGADGSQVRDRYRLITTLLDHDRHPAAELIRLYHERWEIEIAYLALRHTILDGHVLRSQDPILASRLPQPAVPQVSADRRRARRRPPRAPHRTAGCEHSPGLFAATRSCAGSSQPTRWCPSAGPQAVRNGHCGSSAR
jgi:hypothetical protein